MGQAAWAGVRGKLVLITGGTSGIGLTAAEAPAARGAQVTIVARSDSRAKAAVARIAAAGGPGTNVDTLTADLSSPASVRRLADETLERYPHIDVLANNAGAFFTTRQSSPDGLELTWAVNHLAPFPLSTLLLERLRDSAPARIITTSSAAHRGARIPWGDVRGTGDYWGFGRYSQTKLGNILFTVELARRLEGTGVTANCFHPGLVATRFSPNNGGLTTALFGLMKPFPRRPEQGAEPLVWLTEAPAASRYTGQYFVGHQPARLSGEAVDPVAANHLWTETEAVLQEALGAQA